MDVTNQKKLQVFISSTYLDLIEERQAAVEAILKAGHIPAGMELFTASNKSQWDIITRWIDESDIYMLILGGRYGSIENESQKSYTHLEYEYAQSQGKPLFAVVIEDSALDLRKSRDIEKDNPERLNEFREKVLSYMSSFFTDKKDIKLAVHESMGQITQDYGLTGWIRGNQQNSDIAKEMVTLNDELRKLKEENDRLKLEQVKRLPKIEFSINDSQKLDVVYHINKSNFYKARTSIKEIPNHLKKYLTKKEADDYNNTLLALDEITIENYNKIIAKKFNFLELQNNLKLNLLNLGNLPANNIHIYVTFPNFVHILEDKNEVKEIVDELEELALELIPNPLHDPLVEAEKQYKKDSILSNSMQDYLNVSDRFLGTNGHFLPEIRSINNFANLNPYDKNNYDSVKENMITIKLSKLLHGLSAVYSEYLLVPLSKGSGIIEVKIYCEEYLENKTYEIPIFVS
jgi:hypothetical protein